MSKRKASLAERFSGAPVPSPSNEQAYLDELYLIREQEEQEGDSKGGLVKRATRRLTKHKLERGSEDEAVDKGARRSSSQRKLSLAKRLHHKEHDLSLDEQV